MNCSWEDRFAIGRDCMLKNGLCSSSSCSSICSMVSLPFAQLSSPWQYSEFSSNPAHFFFLLKSKASYINEIKQYIHLNKVFSEFENQTPSHYLLLTKGKYTQANGHFHRFQAAQLQNFLLCDQERDCLVGHDSHLKYSGYYYHLPPSLGAESVIQNCPIYSQALPYPRLAMFLIGCDGMRPTGFVVKRCYLRESLPSYLMYSKYQECCQYAPTFLVRVSVSLWQQCSLCCSQSLRLHQPCWK